MLKIKPAASSFEWPIKVRVPTDQRHVEQSFTGVFKPVDRDRLIALTPGDAEEDQALLEEVFVGWSGVQDENGNEFPFSADARRTLLNIPYVRAAVTTAFFEAIGGPQGKKLTEVAEAWAAGRLRSQQDDSDLDDDIELYGLDRDLIPGDYEPVELFEDCVRTVELFMLVNTQWRVGFSGRDSLDYAAAWSTFDKLGMTVSEEEFHGVQVMERAALDVWAESRKQ